MSIQETYAFYGDTIDCIYYSTAGYKRVTLTKSSNMYTWDFGLSTDYGQPSWVDSNYWVGYFATVDDFSSNPSYMQFNISPNVHFSHCTSVRVAAAAHSPSSISSSVYSPSIVKLNDGTGDLIYSTSGFTYDGFYPVGRMHRSSYFDCMPVWAEYDSNVIANINVLQFAFSGANTTGSGGIEIYLMAPFINDGAIPETGIVTTATNVSQDIAVNVTVDVDLSPLQTDVQAVGSQLADVASDVAGVKNDVQGIVTDVSAIASLLAGGDETYINLDLAPIDTLPTLNYDELIDTAAAVMDEIPSGIAASASLWAVLGEILQTDVIWIWLVPLCMFLSLAAFILYRG